MQSFELGHLWEQILAHTKPQLPPPIWENAIHSGLIPASFNNNILTLYPMHEFVRNLLMQNTALMSALVNAATEIVGAPVDVSIFDGNNAQSNITANSTPINNTFNNEVVTQVPTEQQTNTNLNQQFNAQPLKPDLPKIDPMVMPKTIEPDEILREAIPIAPGAELPSSIDDLAEITSTQETPMGGLFDDPNYYDEPVIITKPSQNQKQYNETPAFNQTQSTNKAASEEEFNFETNNLNPSYTFESFVTGNTNRIAYAAAMSVAENPAQRYNPLFIYGDSGLGKTHLMHAIGNAILKISPEKKVRCISSETFMNDLIHAIQNNRNEYFRDRYRSVDVLLVDDIQFLQSKQSTQTEFFHTFNTLQDSHKQIVLTSDTMPSNMKGMEKRLQTRFEGGYIVTIDTPDLETRIAILRSKADTEMFRPSQNVYENAGRIISRDEMKIVINTIATNVKNNIRTLEGSFTKVINTACILKTKITTDFVYDLIKDVIDPTQSRQLDIPLIQECISEYFKIKMEDLLGSKRKKHLVHPRQIAMYLCRELVNASYPSIAESFGKKDHTTVIHAYDKIDKEIKQKKETKRYVEEIKEELKNACG